MPSLTPAPFSSKCGSVRSASPTAAGMWTKANGDSRPVTSLTVALPDFGALASPLPELAQTRPDVFVLEYDRLNQAIGAVAGRVTARRVAFRVLPNFDAWSQRTWWREAAKHLLFRAVDALLGAWSGR